MLATCDGLVCDVSISPTGFAMECGGGVFDGGGGGLETEKCLQEMQ